MPNRLEGIKLKIERAKNHIRDLESVIVPFLDTEPYTHAADLLPQISHYSIRLATVKPLPSCIPIIIGDAIHNVRSALDHLAWQLVEAGGGTPNHRTALPIFAADGTAAQGYALAVGKGEMAKMKAGAADLLKVHPTIRNRGQDACRDS
jgi:hypothetical protein